MNQLTKFTLNVCIYFLLVNNTLQNNDLRSAEGKISNTTISLQEKERVANCYILDTIDIQQYNNFFENENFENMKVLGAGHFGEVRDPSSNSQRSYDQQIVVKKIKVKKGDYKLAMNEVYYWQYIQNSKQEKSSGFYQSKSFPDYYGCAIKEYPKPELNNNIQYDFYIKMEKVRYNFDYKNQNSPVTEFSHLNEIQKLKTYLSLLQAIRQMHSENIVHLDIKPDNFMTREQFNIQYPNYPQIVLIDLGLAQPAGRLYKIGNFEFMHPTAFNRVDDFPMIKAFDVYSAILSIIIIESYKKGHGTKYYFQQAQYLDIKKKNETIAQHFNNLQNAINNDFRLNNQINDISREKTQQIEQCFNLNCILSFGMNSDINEIPTIEKFYDQLEIIINYLQTIGNNEQFNQQVFKIQSEESDCFFEQAKKNQFCYTNNHINVNLQQLYSQNYQNNKVPNLGYGGSKFYDDLVVQKFNNSQPYFNRKLNSIHFMQKMQRQQKGDRILEVQTCFIGKVESFYQLKPFKFSFDFEKPKLSYSRESAIQGVGNFLLRNDKIEQYTSLFETLKLLHKSQIVHLHISPDNIVLDYQDKLRFLDYGLQNLSEPIDTLDRNFSHPRMFKDNMAYTFYDIYSLTLSIFYIESMTLKPVSTNYRFFPSDITNKVYFTNNQKFMEKQCIQRSGKLSLIKLIRKYKLLLKKQSNIILIIFMFFDNKYKNG